MTLITVFLFVAIAYQMFNAILIVDPVMEEKLEHFESTGGWRAHQERIESWEAEAKAKEMQKIDSSGVGLI